MCDKARLVEYLYDEMTAPDRQVFEAHLSACDDCRAEAVSLGGVRTALSRWAPPDPDFAFELVRTPTAARSAKRWFRPSPAWGLAAAAVLVLAAAAAVANIEVTYGGGGVTVRTGWGGGQAVPLAERASGAPTLATAAWREEADALNARVHELESALASRGTLAAAHETAPRENDAELLRQVRRLIADSEARQNGAFTLRLTQIVRDIESTRRADLTRIEQAYAHVRGLSDTTSLRQAAIEDRLFRVVGQQK